MKTLTRRTIIFAALGAVAPKAAKQATRRLSPPEIESPGEHDNRKGKVTPRKS